MPRVGKPAPKEAASNEAASEPVQTPSLPLEEIRTKLLVWYTLNRRLLPWRGDAAPYNGTAAKRYSISKENVGANGAGPRRALDVSPYGTWVSEIMLQQTRVDTVIKYYTRWMKAFPDVHACARASAEQINSLWAGLGYYRRARLLHEGCKEVSASASRALPSTVSRLLKVRGIGPYTAGAIASIAFAQRTPLVDGNVIRVFSRLLGIRLPADDSGLRKRCWEVSGDLVCGEGVEWEGKSKATGRGKATRRGKEKGKGKGRERKGKGKGEGKGKGKGATTAVEDEPQGDDDDDEGAKSPRSPPSPLPWSLSLPGELNQSLMELGATVCTPKAPSCSACPVSAHCRALGMARLSPGSISVLDFPAKKQKKAVPVETWAVCVVEATLPSSGSSAACSSSSSGSSTATTSANTEKHYLMVRRPKSGLLAGQWEFPCCLVHREEPGQAKSAGDRAATAGAGAAGAAAGAAGGNTSAAPAAENKKAAARKSRSSGGTIENTRKGRAGALDTFSATRLPGLHRFLTGAADAGFRREELTAESKPVAHVFSHVKHLMHVERLRLPASAAEACLETDGGKSDGAGSE